MGAGASASHGLVAMSVTQVELDEHPAPEIRATLEGLDAPDLLRYLKLYSCQCLRIERRGLDGKDLLYHLDDADLGKLGLTAPVLAMVRRFRREDVEEKERRRAADEAKAKADEAARAAREKKAHEELLRANGLWGIATARTGRELSDAERRRKDYGKMRVKLAQRSAKALETRLLEKRLQEMLRRPEVRAGGVVALPCDCGASVRCTAKPLA